MEAARLVRALCNGSNLTLQTLISCGGLSVLAHFLDAGPRIDGSGVAGTDARRLVRIGIDGVLKVFSLQVSQPVVDFDGNQKKERPHTSCPKRSAERRYYAR